MEITTDFLRGIKPGQSVIVECRDGLEAEAKSRLAYRLNKLGEGRYSCAIANAKTLTITREA